MKKGTVVALPGMNWKVALCTASTTARRALIAPCAVLTSVLPGDSSMACAVVLS
ncbi:hypothetical protein D3C71_1374230 [compost metagenome]